MGYSELARTLAAGGDHLDVVTPEQLRLTGWLSARWWVLVFPVSIAIWLWRRRRQYDVIIFHSYTGWLFNLLSSRLPAITEFHGLEPLFYEELAREHRLRGRQLSRSFRLVYGWMMPRVLAATCRRSRVVTCLNGEERRYLLDHRWAPESRVVLMRQSIPREFFSDGRAYPEASRILMLSQWLETKGTAYLVDAFTELARARPDLRFWCYGTRVPADTVLASFPEDVRSRVVVVPEIAHTAVAVPFHEADIFVHASLSEGSGRAVMQAMAAALPIVVTPVGVVPDLLQDGRDCLIVPKRDGRALSAAVLRLLDDGGLRRRLGEGARRAADAFQPVPREAEHADLVRRVAREASPAA